MSKKYLINNILGVFLIRVTGVLSAMISSIVLARAMGANDFGLVTFVIETVIFISIPFSVGFINLLTREVSFYMYNNQLHLLKGIILWSSRFIFYVSIILSVIIIIVLRFIENIEMRNLLFIALPIIMFRSLGQLRMGSLQGMKHAALSQLPDTILRHLFVVIVISYLYWGLSYNIDASMGVFVNLLSFGFAFFMGIFLLLWKIPKTVKSVKAEYNSIQWIRESIPFFLLGGIGLINTKLSLIIVGLIRPSVEVGYYKIAITASTVVSFLLLAVNITVAPLISELYYRNQKEKLQGILKKSVRIVFLFGFFICIMLWLYGEKIILVIYGSDFLNAYIPLVILSIGQLMNISAGSVGYVLNMTGNQRSTLKGQSIAALINIILNIILIYFFGVMGAAVATSISFLVWNTLLVHFSIKKTGINTTILSII